MGKSFELYEYSYKISYLLELDIKFYAVFGTPFTVKNKNLVNIHFLPTPPRNTFV